MQRFIVERNLPRKQADQIVSAETIAQQTTLLATPHNQIKWIMTLTTDVKVYAVFEAPSAEYLRQTAFRQNFTIHRLLQISHQL